MNLYYFFCDLYQKKSYFQLIGFGSDFKKINKTPQEYTKENVQLTKQLISNLNADLGGTNISSPLKENLILKIMIKSHYLEIYLF